MEKNDKGTTTLKSRLKASMVRNIDGKILGKDGKLLAPVRQVVRVSKVQHGMSSDNEGTEDHTLKAVDVHESSNAHDQQEPNRAKPVEMVYNTLCFQVIDDVDKSAMYLFVLYAFA
ncbi:hypothetical protein Tco_0061537, partial [Tanacetum coccineum]